MELGIHLSEKVNSAAPLLLAISNESASLKPLPDKWSKKEILGHLIDSACNNHRRFVTAQFKDDMIFEGYAQDQWVDYQEYQQAHWHSLVDLWVNYNQHIARIIDLIPIGVLKRQHDSHNLHLLAWQQVPKGEMTSMEYFIQDYIDHLQHHLNQILK